MTEQHLNIAGYKFVVLDDRDALRQPFKQKCDELGLKGTILLSHEGINIFVAGPERTSINSDCFFVKMNDFQTSISKSRIQNINRSIA